MHQRVLRVPSVDVLTQELRRHVPATKTRRQYLDRSEFQHNISALNRKQALKVRIKFLLFCRQYHHKAPKRNNNSAVMKQLPFLSLTGRPKLGRVP